jgi:hypothetical protein
VGRAEELERLGCIRRQVRDEGHGQVAPAPSIIETAAVSGAGPLRVLDAVNEAAAAASLHDHGRLGPVPAAWTAGDLDLAIDHLETAVHGRHGPARRASGPPARSSSATRTTTGPPVVTEVVPVVAPHEGHRPWLVVHDGVTRRPAGRAAGRHADGTARGTPIRVMAEAGRDDP